MRDQWNLLASAGWRMDDVITKDQVLRLLSRQKELNFQPGEEYAYCNSGFTLLAEVVSRISEKTFDEFTQERIFTPLAMHNTLFYEDHEQIVMNRAYSYQGSDDSYKKKILSFSIAGATSLFTTAEDLCSWAQHMNNPSGKTRDIIEEMNTLATLNNGETFGGAMGQFVETYHGLLQIQHGGADAGYRSFLGRFPEQDFAVAVLSNYAGFNPGGMARAVADIYLEDEMTAGDAQPESAGGGFVEREHIELKKSQLKAFEGTFWNEEGAYSRTMYVNDDATLMYSRGANRESRLLPITENSFQMQDVEVDLLVTFEGMGDARTMIVIINGGDPVVSTYYEPIEATPELLAQYTGKFYSEELDAYYLLEVVDEELIAHHLRTGDATLTYVKHDRFSYLGSIVFQRDDDGCSRWLFSIEWKGAQFEVCKGGVTSV